MSSADELTRLGISRRSGHRGLLSLIWRRVVQQDLYAGFLLLERLAGASRLVPNWIMSEFGRAWLDDQSFREFLRTYVPDLNSADRKFTLLGLARLVDHLPGDVLEAGTHEGSSAALLATAFSEPRRTVFTFDSFEGMSAPTAIDGTFWAAGDLAGREEEARRKLGAFGEQVVIRRGWIPEVLSSVEDRSFCFVHIDVDLYQPTLDTLRFVESRVTSGAAIVCDDYGFISCPGARAACDEFAADRPEKWVELTTGQAFLICR